MTKVKKGTHLVLFHELPDGGAVPFAMSTSHGIDKTIETKETTSKDDGDNTNEEATKVKWSFSIDGLCSWNAGSDYLQLDELADAMEPITILFGEVDKETRQLIAGPVKRGRALITSVKATFPDKDNSTYSASFNGIGKLEQMNYDPAANNG